MRKQKLTLFISDTHVAVLLRRLVCTLAQIECTLGIRSLRELDINKKLTKQF